MKRSNGKPELVFSEILGFAYDTFRAHKMRFALTALGMVIGTASLILVVTIGLSGKHYVMNQIQGIGANIIYVSYEGADIYGKGTGNDFLTTDDLRAVQQQVNGIQAVSPMVQLHDNVVLPGGKEAGVGILGVSPEYKTVRSLEVVAGRFFDNDDQQQRNKIALVTGKLAQKLFGSPYTAVGQEIRLMGLPFTVVGTFRERVETFGMSEVQDDTVLVPSTVARYFTDTDNVKQIFVSMTDSSQVPQATELIRHAIQARHRPESVYSVENLTEVQNLASTSATALTAVLLLIAVVTLIVSGVGIMNIMLATVSARIKEIGIRKAMGATQREIRYQFLAEAVFISVAGGLIGIFVGLAVPFSARFFTALRIPISGLSAIIAILVSTGVGVLFGTVPASRAAKLDPVESLHHE